jgi:lysosomal alpha-mannosidase
VIAALLANPERKFMEVEMKFFKMWWDVQTDDMKGKVRGLV